MNNAASSNDLPWRVRQRFIFLEQRLYWEGRLNRSDLMQAFEISAPQASADIDRYKELELGNIEYDRSQKLYFPSPDFTPKYVQPDARKYLSQLLMLADDALSPDESWLGTIPAHDAIPRVRRRLDAAKLRPIVLAIHQRRAIQVTYQSMSAPEPMLRWIAPHALAFDGARWHARAWCYNTSMFKDFVLARILSVDGSRDGSVDNALDWAWQAKITLRLGPHPGLPPAQRRAIELDYDMVDGSVAIKMRSCLVYYFERHWGLDLPADILSPSRRQVVLLNREEVDAFLTEIGEKNAR